MEKWVKVKGWECSYEVSDLGRVRSIDKQLIDSSGKLRSFKGRIKKPYKNKNRGGYFYVTFNNKTINKVSTKSVHRLVAEAFLFNKNNKHLIVDHINGDREDNRLCNLQLVTYRENTHKGNLNGNTSEFIGVCWHKRNKKWTASIYHNKKQHHLGNYDCELEAKKAYDKKLKEIENG